MALWVHGKHMVIEGQAVDEIENRFYVEEAMDHQIENGFYFCFLTRLIRNSTSNSGEPPVLPQQCVASLECSPCDLR